MLNPKIEQVIDGWELSRYDYDGCPLRAVHRGSDIEIEINEHGEAEILIPEGRGYLKWVPSAVVAALVDDAKKRGVL